jgi:hypothetical protein
MVHVPSVTSVTVVPDTVHTDPVRLLNVTVSPESAVAATGTEPSDNGVSGVGVNVIVWPTAWIWAGPSVAATAPVEVSARGPGPLAGAELAVSAPMRPARGAGAPVRSAVDGSAERVFVARARVSVAALDACVRGRSDRFPPAVGDALAVPGPLGVRVLFLALPDFDFAAASRAWPDAAVCEGRVPPASTSAAAAGTAIRPDPAANRTSIPSPAARFRARVDDLRR